MFEKGIKQKLRFSTNKGLATIEDLYDLNEEALDSLYRPLNKELKAGEEESLLKKTSKNNETLKLKVEILKYIVESKLKDRENRENLRNVSKEETKLVEALARKEDSELENLSADEIKVRLAKLKEMKTL